jgi:membrane-associated phospholipid phosphatase
MIPSLPRADGSRFRPPTGGPSRRLIALALTLACLAGASLSIDLPMARLCKSGAIPKGIMRFLNFAEVFGHGLGVASILISAAVLDPSLAGRRVPRRLFGLPASPDLARMVTTAFAGGLAANVVKAALVDRVRPRAADLSAATSALTTFGGSLAAAVTSHSDVNSFPSGHAATAAGLAAALAWKYPRGAWLFAAWAISVALQRVATSAHYPSDVCAGAALGLSIAAYVLGNATPTQVDDADSP